MPKVNTLPIKRPTPEDLPAGHPFRNPTLLAAMQKKFPKYKPMKAKDYRLKPYVHPANVVDKMDRAIVEVFPPYDFLPSEFVKGKAALAEIKWPSHAYVISGLDCEGRPAIIQMAGVHAEGGLVTDGCFRCKLQKEGYMNLE